MGDQLVIPDYEEISNLRDLENALRFLKRAVSEGALKQFWETESVGITREKIENIEVFGPYPDVLILNFASPSSGKKYELSVETYHGSGGEWSLIE